MSSYFIVVFPSLALLQQFYQSHISKSRPPLRKCQVNALAACSKDKKEINISMCTGSGKSRVIIECLPADGIVEYYATDRTLPDITRISVSNPGNIILTTYISAPLVFRILSELDVLRTVQVIHDEAHHIISPIYKESYDNHVDAGLIKKTINLSATLPEGYEYDYIYSLLEGIRDGVVRDFHIKAITCLSGDNEQSFVDIINLARDWARSQGKTLRLLVYTSEANTDNDVDTEGGTSVRSFLDYFAHAASENGWWMRGLHNDTMGDREEILRGFEENEPESGIAILVSCRTLSEGVDLRNANVMLPWDPSSDAKTNIQRIGRILRKYKNSSSEYLPLEQQTPSLVIIPVWLDKDIYMEFKGDTKNIHDQLYKDIENGTRGSFTPLLNVTAALKSELTFDDELFREVINFPSNPKSGTFTGNVIEVVAKNLKKKLTDVVMEMGEDGVLNDDIKDVLDVWANASVDKKDSVWKDIPKEEHSTLLDALVVSQDLTLLIEQEKSGDPEVFGSGSIQKTLERKPDGTYVVTRRKRETLAETKAKKEVQKRVSLCTTASCRVFLGLEEGAFEDGKSLVRLTTRIEFESESDYVWNKRFEQWKTFAEKHKKTPLFSDVDEQGNHIGYWGSKQRYYIHMLSQDKIEILSSHPYWKWKYEDPWNHNFDNWKAFAEKHQRTPYVNDIDEYGNNIGSWQHQQRKKFRSHSLSSNIIDLLNSHPHWKWNYEDPWNHNFDNWIRFAEKHHKTPFNSDIDEEGNKIGGWQKEQRRKYKDNTLSEEKIKKLNSHSLWKWERGDLWEDNWNAWKTFVDKHNKTPFNSYIDEYGNKIGQWQSSQRQNYKKNKLSKEQINKLESHSLWKWEHEDPWEDNWNAWKSFTGKTGSAPTFNKMDEYGNKLGFWQNSQRQNYKQNKLSEEKIKKLESHPLWKWERENPWEDNWNAWKEFVDINKRDPYKEEKNNKGFTVGQWQHNQRQHYKKNKLSEEKIKILNAHPLWRWVSKIHINRRTNKNSKKKTSNSKVSLHQHIASQLEMFHKKYKTMNSSTYFSHIKDSPKDWEDYHKIADQYDKRDTPENSPHHRIANFIKSKKYPDRTKVIDLGCGMDRLRDDSRVSHLDWTSVDAIPVSDRVIQADLGSLPMEDNMFNIAVISRALWARKPDHITQLKEAFRVICQGGILILCESRKKWIKEITDEVEDGCVSNIRTRTVNELSESVKKVGFSVVGGSSNDDTSVWQFIICMKPEIGGI